jgi:predicted Zn-dependent peptidase
MLRMEDSRSVAAWLGTQELLLGEVATVDNVIQSIDSVNATEISRIAQQLLAEDKLKLAVVGPHRSEKFLRNLLHF